MKEELKNLGGVECFSLVPEDQGGDEKLLAAQALLWFLLWNQEVFWWRKYFGVLNNFFWSTEQFFLLSQGIFMKCRRNFLGRKNYPVS